MSYVEDRLQEIADAIREKEGSVDPIPAPEFPSRILAIETGVDTSDATATPEDILERKTAYVNGVKIRGTMENIGLATPTISVEPTTGVVTATTVQKRGFIDAATKSASKQLDTQAGKTVMPTTINRTAVARGLYTTGDVIVAGDANLTPNNIRDGVSIFGVDGTMTAASGVNTADATATPADIRTGVTAYIASGRVNGAMPNAGTITGILGNTGNANWNSSNPNVGSGTVTITNVQQDPGYTDGFSGGSIVVTVPENRLLKGRIVTPTTAAQKIAEAEDIAYGAISVVGDTNLVPSNIKSGVTIFGVTGTASTGSTGTDTSDATATASDIASGKTAYGPSGKMTGTVVEEKNDVTRGVAGYKVTFGPGEGSSAGSNYLKLPYTYESDVLIRSGVTITHRLMSTSLGDATAADVKIGKTFTSKAGYKVEGTGTVYLKTTIPGSGVGTPVRTITFDYSAFKNENLLSANVRFSNTTSVSLYPSSEIVVGVYFHIYPNDVIEPSGVSSLSEDKNGNFYDSSSVSVTLNSSKTKLTMEISSTSAQFAAGTIICEIDG